MSFPGAVTLTPPGRPRRHWNQNGTQRRWAWSWNTTTRRHWPWGHNRIRRRVTRTAKDIILRTIFEPPLFVIAWLLEVIPREDDVWRFVGPVHWLFWARDACRRRVSAVTGWDSRCDGGGGGGQGVRDGALEASHVLQPPTLDRQQSVWGGEGGVGGEGG